MIGSSGDFIKPSVFAALVITIVALSVPARAQTQAERESRIEFVKEVKRLMIEEGLSEQEAYGKVRQARQAEALQKAQSRLAAQRQPIVAGRPQEAFAGCETVIAQAQNVGEPRERIEKAAKKVDSLSAREFASFSVDDIDAGLNREKVDACWFRLDGIWREDKNVALDINFRPKGWASVRPELVHLANGTYTTPIHVSILPTKNPEEVILVKLVNDVSQPIPYTSADGITLKRLIDERGLRKVYRAPRPTPAPGLAQLLTIDVTRTGYLRIRIGAYNYYRPAPGTVTKVSGDDPFMIGYTMENLSASYKGYDVTSQNPNRLLQNPKSNVFDFATDRGAVIDQRRVVPLGLKLIKEETQGTVHYSTNVSSEREFQQMTSSTMGNSTKIGISGSGGAGGKDGGASASVNAEAGYGWGSDSARQQHRAMVNSGSVAEEVGYMRFKKLALVLDPPYARLTDRFIDAVADAQRYGNFRELIGKFGTHYPYAVTYGAAGEVRQKITRQAYEKRRQSQSSSSSNERGSFIVGETSTYRSSQSQTSSSLRESNEYGQRTFDAVGGNGSWDQNGFSAGDAHYPILADMRPLSELLNPIYFPGQPEIYIDLRQKMSAAITAYLASKANLSDDTLIPDVVPALARMLVTTHIGSTEYLTLRMTSKTGAPAGQVRVCLKNDMGGTRTLALLDSKVFPGTVPQSLRSKGSGFRTCKNMRPFLVQSLIGLTSIRNDKATIAGQRNLNLNSYRGGTLEFLWNKNG